MSDITFVPEKEVGSMHGMRLPRLALAAAVVCAILAPGVAAGASKSPDPTKISGTIRFLTSTSQRPGWTVMISNFNRVYPNVTVDVQYVAGGSPEHISTLSTQLQAGNGPDVFQDYPGTGGALPAEGVLQKAGYLMDLSSQPWVKKAPKFVRSVTDIKGRTYAHENAIGFQVVVYNVGKFRSLGLTVPTTFAQLKALCATIRQKSPDSIPIAFAASNSAFAGYAAGQFALNNVYAKTPNWSSLRAKGKTSFGATAGWKSAMKSFVDLKNAGCFGPSVASDGSAQVIAQMGSGQAFMSLTLSGQFGAITASSPKERFSLFAVPGATKASTRLFVYPSAVVSINAHTKNKAAAIAFVNFIARPKQADVFNRAAGYGQIAPYNFQKGIWPDSFKPLKGLIHKAAVGPFFTWPTVATYTAMAAGVQGILTGQQSVEQLLAAMDSSWGKG